jgi:hypothetical protein
LGGFALVGVAAPGRASRLWCWLVVAGFLVVFCVCCFGVLVFWCWSLRSCRWLSPLPVWLGCVRRGCLARPGCCWFCPFLPCSLVLARVGFRFLLPFVVGLVGSLSLLVACACPALWLGRVCWFGLWWRGFVPSLSAFFLVAACVPVFGFACSLRCGRCRSWLVCGGLPFFAVCFAVGSLPSWLCFFWLGVPLAGSRLPCWCFRCLGRPVLPLWGFLVLVPCSVRQPSLCRL